MLTRKRKREIEYQDSAQRALRLVRSFQFVSPARRRWNIIRNVIKRLQILRWWTFDLRPGQEWTRSDQKYNSIFNNLLRREGEGDTSGRYELNLRPIRGTPPIGRGIARLMPLP